MYVFSLTNDRDLITVIFFLDRSAELDRREIQNAIRNLFKQYIIDFIYVSSVEITLFNFYFSIVVILFGFVVFFP